MVNEFAYCPRLFFLEWVQARFADNSDTVDGRYQHRVVDAESGRAPGPEHAADLRGARSLLISAPSLGLIGRIDLLEGHQGVVTPVDYKRGQPAPGAGRAWDPERRQLAVHALMLRDAGYTVDRAVLYFVETRERVDVELTELLLEETLASVVRLRAVAARDQAPPPLVDSPKCPRCSLVGLCLPDEHNLLLARSERAPRRLVPSDQAARPVYLTEAGSSVSVRSERLEVCGRPSRDPAAPVRKTSIRLLDVSQVNAFGNVQVSTQALRQLFVRDIPVLYFSGGGWLEGIAQGLPSKHVQLRIRQVAAVGNGGLPAARMIVRGKIRNCRVLLRRNGRTDTAKPVAELAELATRAAEAGSVASLLGVEGAAARTYFQAFATMIRADQQHLPGLPFGFEGCNRRPPRDPVNCLLSFGYALLVKDLVATCVGVGLDPYLGVFHRPRFGRPALALDLAEEFRPLLADSVAINVINNGEVRPHHFVVRAGGVALTADGRKAVIAAYERRLDVEVTHPVYRYRITYRRVLEVQARVLAAWLLGEVPDYAAFTTR